jgi:hypothetical protein
MAATFQDFAAVCFRFMFYDIAPRRWRLIIRKNMLVSSSRVEMAKKIDISILTVETTMSTRYVRYKVASGAVPFPRGTAP